MADRRRCHKCGTEQAAARFEFRALCSSCGAYLHACLNCRHYDPDIYHQCRASATAEYAGDKEGFNFCEEFDFRAGGKPSGGRLTRRDAEDLFKGQP